MKCPVCKKGSLTIIGDYESDLLLICKDKLQLKPTCQYVMSFWDLPESLMVAIDKFLKEYELELKNER